MSLLQSIIQRRLPPGVVINGPNDWDPQIRAHYEGEVFRRMVLHGSVGAGETYTEGLWWTNKEAALEEFFYRLLADQGAQRFRGVTDIFHRLRARLTNMQKGRESEVGETHYDKFSELKDDLLGSTGQYSCAFFIEDAKTLDEAQLAKMRRTAKKLKLKPGMRVLDVGCGWGGFARFLAEEFHVTVVGLTISEKQEVIAREHCRGCRAQIHCMAFEHAPEGWHGTFDRIVSVGMFEHVGPDNYKAFFEKARALLKPNGIMLLHTIGSLRTKKYGNGWIHKYIFPNGVIPSDEQIVAAYREYFRMRHWEDYGTDYGPTLMFWYRNLVTIRAKAEDLYGPEFYRMTVFYLLSCAASFRAGQHLLWQIVLTPLSLPVIEYRADW